MSIRYKVEDGLRAIKPPSAIKGDASLLDCIGFSFLDPGTSFEFWIAPVFSSIIPFEINMSWYDEDKKEHSRTQHMTLQM